MTAVRLYNNAEYTGGGTVTANAGAMEPDGNGWDTVTIGSGAALTRDNAHNAHGNRAYKCVTTTTQSCLLEWGTTMGTQTEIYGRVYIYITANPAASIRFLRVLNGATKEGALDITTTGKVGASDSSGTVTSTGTSLTLNAWNRIEFHYKASASAGVMSADLYTTADSFTRADTVTASGTNTGTQITKIDFGNIVANAAGALTCWLDDINVNVDGLPGPTFLEQATVSPTGSGLVGATKAGSLLLVALAMTLNTTSVTSISDGTANVYTKVIAKSSAAAGTCELWQCPNALSVAAGTSLSVVVSNNLDLPTGIWSEYSNIETVNALDQTAGATGTASTAVDSGATGTTTGYPEVWIGVASSVSATETFKATAGWNNVTDASSLQTGNSNAIAMQDQVQNATGTADSAMTGSASLAWVGLVATFFCKTAENFIRSISETLSAASDSVSRTMTTPRSVSESVGVGDVWSRVMAYGRSLAESATTATDAPSRRVSVARSASESVGAATDSPTRVMAYGRSLSEGNTSASDSASRLAAYARAPAESVSASDSVARLIVVARSLSEAVSAADVPGRTVGYGRSSSEAVAASDVILRTVAASRSIAEILSAASDAPDRGITASRSVGESASALDAVLRQAGYSREIDEDPLVASDLVARFFVGNRSVSEAVNASDSVSRQAGYFRELDETAVVATDMVLQGQSFARLISESVAAASDSVSRTVFMVRPVIETVAATDAVLRGFAGGRSLSEAVGPAQDAPQRSVFSLRLLTETGVVSIDGVTRQLIAARVQFEVGGTALDLAERTWAGARSISELVGPATDLVEVLRAFGRFRFGVLTAITRSGTLAPIGRQGSLVLVSRNGVLVED